MVRVALALVTILAGAAILGTAAAAGGGGCHSTDPSASQARGTAVEIRQCKFTPVVLFAPVGATVIWAQNDVVPHNVVGLGWGDSTLLMTGAQSNTNPSVYKTTFATPGIYPYHCTLHPEMSGVVIVGDVDVTGASAPLGAAAPSPTPAPTSAATPRPTAIVASAATAPGPGTDLVVAGGLGALAISGLAGFAVGRRRRSTA